MQKIIVSGILLNDKKEFLVARRSLSKKIAPGLYHLPGGHVEHGESPEDALIREFQEEFKLQIIPINSVRTFSYTVDDVHTIGITYLVESNQQDIDTIWFDRSDNESVHWVSLEEAKELFPENDHDLITIQEYYSIII